MAGGGRGSGGGAGNGRETAGPAAPKVSIGRLPRTGSEMFGREEELAWLDRCWSEGAHVASIVAWGGVGKSALVNAWLRNMQRDGWRGAERVYAWSFYSQGTTDRNTSPDEFISTALRELGDEDPTAGSPWAKGERLAGLVCEGRVLLVLDGVEPLQSGPGPEEGKIKDPALQALLRELGAQNRGMCLLTSRIAVRDLEDYGASCRLLRLEHLSVEAGAELLKARKVAGPDEELREAAREYDGHALALALLGSYLYKSYGGDIRKRIDIGPLEEETRQGKHARRIMAAYERWFEGKPELCVLRMLGLFDRPADAEEIAALRAPSAIAGLTDALAGVAQPRWSEALTTLRDVGLMAPGDDGGEVERLDAHPLVREHFGERLREEQPDAWREGHRRLYEHLKQKAKPLPETLEEMAPLYAAVIHGCRAGRHQEALEEVFWRRIRRGREAFDLHRLGAFGSEVAVLSAFFDPPWERLAPGLDAPDEAFILNDAGFGLRALGRLPEATRLLRMGLKQRMAMETWQSAAIAASNLSQLFQLRGELKESLTHAQLSVELADKSGDAEQRINRRTTLAAVLHAMGRGAEATEQFEGAERMEKEFGLGRSLLHSVRGFLYCELLLDQGLDAEVRTRAEQTLAWVTARRNLLSMALDHLSLGRAHLLAASRGTGSELDQAAAHLKEAVEGLRRSGQQDELPRGLLARADYHLHTNNPARARADLDEVLKLSTRCSFRLHEADAHLRFTRLHLAEGDLPRAREHLARARDLITDTGYHRRDDELARLEAAFTDAEARRRSAAPTAQPADLPEARPATSPDPAPDQGPAPMASTPEPRFDVAIVCALRRPELQKVRRTGKEAWEEVPSHPDDPTGYHRTTYTTKRGRRLSVVAAAPTQMGMPASAVLATKMIRRFRPTLVVMVGIAAGAKNDKQGFGDILAPDFTFDYNAGKVTIRDGKLHVEPDPQPIHIQARLRDRLKHWSSERLHLDEVCDGWQASTPRTRLQLHVGPLGSGAAVLDTSQPVAEVLEHWRKLIGVEMEAYGVHIACRDAAHPETAFVCFKSICDFAADKSDDWQDYAAYTAAELCHRFLTEEWEDLHLDPADPR